MPKQERRLATFATMLHDIDISISKADAYESVGLYSAYRLAKAGRAADSEVVDEDASMLDLFWSEHKAEIATALRKWIKADASTDNEVRLTLAIGNPALASSIQQALRSSMRTAIASRWESLTRKPSTLATSTPYGSPMQRMYDEGTVDKETSSQLLLQALAMITQRRAPIRQE